jgi:TRAP transporter TAXI family solute receptor
MRQLILICVIFMSSLVASEVRANNEVVLYAGQQAGTYHSFGEDMASLFEKSNIKLNVITTDGSIENIRKVAGSKKPAIGLVQSDVLGFMRRSNNPDTQHLSEQLRMVLPLYDEEVHVLTRREIKRWSDLKDKRVVVGEEGSGNMLTAVNMLAISDILVKDTLRLSPAQGVLAVLEGKADAVIFVGGKPVKLFKNIETLETAEGKKFAPLLKNVHFIPVTSPNILAEYASASITHDDYSFVTETIPTIAVQAVLITGNYLDTSKADACKAITTISNTLRTELPKLKSSGHPKWKEVDYTLPVSLWEKDTCSWGSGK